MPRNKSEALPECRPAQAYADCIEKWLGDGREMPNLGPLWRALPESLKTSLNHVFYNDYAHRVLGSFGGVDQRVLQWRQYSVDYIRRTYAP